MEPFSTIEAPSDDEQDDELAIGRALSSLDAARVRTGAMLDRRELHRAIARFNLNPLDAAELEERASARGLLATRHREELVERSADIDLVALLFSEMRRNGLLT